MTAIETSRWPWVAAAIVGLVIAIFIVTTNRGGVVTVGTERIMALGLRQPPPAPIEPTRTWEPVSLPVRREPPPEPDEPEILNAKAPEECPWWCQVFRNER